MNWETTILKIQILTEIKSRSMNAENYNQTEASHDNWRSKCCQFPIFKYHLYSSLRTHLNLNGDNSLTFKRTLQVPQINVLFIHYKIAYAMFLLQIIQLKGNMEILWRERVNILRLLKSVKSIPAADI